MATESGIAHWMIYHDAVAAPLAPWFVEHRDDGRTPHWMDDHEYGSFETYGRARRAMLEWSQRECEVRGEPSRVSREEVN